MKIRSLSNIVTALSVGVICSGLMASNALAEVTAPGMDISRSPAQTVAVAVDPAQIDRAIRRLDGLAHDVLLRTQVPGLAIAVVRDGRTVYAKGFGVRRVGASDLVDADTVFQIASLSKSVSATVVAREIGLGKIAWNTPVVEHLPWFKLEDAWVTSHVTIGDMFSHKSGLPDHAGDDLEDLGYDGRQVLERLRFAPLHSFRDQYAYTNFGLTAAADSVAAASGIDWPSLAKQAIYQPLNMNSTSSRFSDFEHRTNRAVGHIPSHDGFVQSKYQRQPDAQSPAGGVSSSANDMARWMSMVLQGGVFEGKRIVAASALLPAITAEVVSAPSATADSRASSYGYGFGVGVAPSGRVVLSHSGAFTLGAATNYVMIPSLGVGIVILSNASPVGAVETIGMDFADLVQFGTVTRDWLAGYAKIMAQLNARFGSLVDKQPPPHPTPAAPLAGYIGSYANNYYGNIKVEQQGDGLVLRTGPGSKAFALKHWDGEVFVFDISSENAPDGSISMVTFTPGSIGRAKSLAIELFAADGHGSFTRL